MKLLSWKSTFIVALCFVVLGTVIVSCRKPAAVQPQQERYPHEHLQTSALESNAQLRTVDYKLRDGETLASVARLRYGHQNYYRVIKLYNNLEDERQLAADYTLRLPEISVILAEESLTKLIPQDVALILCSRAKYDKVVKQLWVLRAESTNNYQLPTDVRQELLEAADDLQQVTESLKQPKPGVTGVPKHMIGQLEQNMLGMRALAQGEHSDPNGYDIDMVQQRFALALAYSIIWAREGFK
ncbi:MAG TPA: hypothetical protein VN844_07805 [Pyrinomonadaceae bacterium]|nr:hypothetical protein [Pyrinomonadaceae bacterium]